MNMRKLTAWFEVLKKGYILANPEKWKNRQILANTLTGLLVAVASLVSVYGLVPAPIDPDLLTEIATVVSAVVFLVINNFLTVATTKKVGFKPKATKPVSQEEKTAPESEPKDYFLEDDFQ